MNKIPFSPPDISQQEMDEVMDTLRSGWITTGPKVKQLEKMIGEYCGSSQQPITVNCLNSATAGLELILRQFGIGPGDEVITTPYTFAATANIIIHVGAKPVFADLKPGEFNIDPGQISNLITEHTKAVIVVDFGGFPCDYDEIFEVLKSKKDLYRPRLGSYQQNTDRPILIADSAHAFGAEYHGKRIGSVADFTVFSFHAVKNLSTAEGGAVCYHSPFGLENNQIYERLRLLSLHGQSKDALEKLKGNSWKYEIMLPGYKHNMTDIQAALGIAQLRRYQKEIFPARKNIYERYIQHLTGDPRIILPPFVDSNKQCAYHLFPIRIRNADEKQRDEIIQLMAEKGIATNVHFIPLPQHPYYKQLGYQISDYPHCFEMYRNEISLPLYSKLSAENVDLVCETLLEILE